MSENKVTVLGKNAEERLEILRDEKGNILLTDDQKRAVLERGRILVSASAGSGKTSTMVKRIIVMISEGTTLKICWCSCITTPLPTNLKRSYIRNFLKRLARLRVKSGTDSDKRSMSFRFAIFARYTHFASRSYAKTSTNSAYLRRSTCLTKLATLLI